MVGCSAGSQYCGGQTELPSIVRQSSFWDGSCGSNWSLVGLSRHCRRYARLERRRETEVITGAEPFKQLQRMLEFVWISGCRVAAVTQRSADEPTLVRTAYLTVWLAADSPRDSRNAASTSPASCFSLAEISFERGRATPEDSCEPAQRCSCLLRLTAKSLRAPVGARYSRLDRQSATAA